MSGPGESAKEIRMPSQKCHPASQVASVVSVKPQAAAAARTDVTIARQVGGEQCEAVAHRFQADLVGAPGRGSVGRPVSQGNDDLRVTPRKRGFTRVDEPDLPGDLQAAHTFKEGGAK